MDVERCKQIASKVDSGAELIAYNIYISGVYLNGDGEPHALPFFSEQLQDWKVDIKGLSNNVKKQLFEHIQKGITNTLDGES